MKKLFLCLSVVMLLGGCADKVQAQELEQQDHIADETWAETTKAGKYKITTYNEQIAKMLIEHFYKCECIRYSFSFEKSKGKYDPKWIIYLPGEKKDEIVKAFDKPKRVNG